MSDPSVSRLNERRDSGLDDDEESEGSSGEDEQDLQAAGDEIVIDIKVKVFNDRNLVTSFVVEEINTNKTGDEIKIELLNNSRVTTAIQQNPQRCQLYHVNAADSRVRIEGSDTLTSFKTDLAGGDSRLEINAVGIPAGSNDENLGIRR